MTWMAIAAIAALSCDPHPAEGPGVPTTPRPTARTANDAPHHDGENVDSRPPPMSEPVPLWENGAVVRQVDAATAAEHGFVVVDLGEEWTPYLFTEHTGRNGEHVE